LQRQPKEAFAADTTGIDDVYLSINTWSAARCASKPDKLKHKKAMLKHCWKNGSSAQSNVILTESGFIRNYS
jgi:hypothetical protein